MKLYSDIQWRRGCKPLLTPDPAGETRWNGCIDKTIRAWGTYVKQITACLLAPTGDDLSLDRPDP